MSKKSIPTLLSLWLVSAGMNIAQASPDWTDVAEADLKLMGNYVGEWYEAPEKSYQLINPTLSAQVINVDVGVYDVRFVQNLDRRAENYHMARGAQLADGSIDYQYGDWTIELDETGMRGTGSIYGKVAKFHYNLARILALMKRTTDAQASFRSAIQFDPLHGLAHTGLAKQLQEENGVDHG